jgi:ribosome maturation factor RimP
MIQGADSPLILCTVINKYMKISEIIDAIDSEIVARGLYIIEVTVSKDNDVEVTIESEEGKVELEDCVAISRFFETKFDRETEDYSLTVTSAGLDQPFKVLKQFVKAVGKKVEVQLKGGKKMVAVLEAADEESITLKYSQKEAVEGKKKKEIVEHVDRFTMDQVNSVRPFVEFN